jgi:hypothetical protein
VRLATILGNTPAERSARRSLVLVVNRVVWMVTLGAWGVVLAVGSYLGRLHLHVLGAVSLSLTMLLGLAYVLTAGGRRHRALGIIANATLAGEMLIHFMIDQPLEAVRTTIGLLATLVFLGVPLALLLDAPDSEV